MCDLAHSLKVYNSSWWETEPQQDQVVVATVHLLI